MDRTSLSAHLDALRDHRVYLAHNANVDAITSASAVAPSLAAPAERPRSGSVDSPAVLARGIADAMERGDGDLVAITDEFGEWLEATVEPEAERLGGQAGLMADLLSVVGADPILYTYLLTETQRSMFTDPGAIEFPVVREGNLELVPLSDVTNAEQTKINWIFEFEEGEPFHGVTATADSRFIAAARPERVDLETGLGDVVTDLADRIDCALLSGYHSMKRAYADGSTYEDCIERGRAFVRQLRADADLPVQVEYGVTHKDGLRRAMAERILPEVDAVGLDSRELGLLLDDLDVTDGPEGDDVVSTYRQLECVRRELGVDCVKAHRTHYFLAATSGEYCSPGAIRRGWDVASVVAAAKATEGTIRDVTDLEVGLDVEYSEAGRAAVEALAEHLDAEVEHDALATEDVVAHPNRVVDDPQGTVGLGDSVSVANFAVEQALAERPEQSPPQ